MWRPDSDWNTAGIQAAVEGGDQVDSCTATHHASVTNASERRKCHQINRDRTEVAVHLAGRPEPRGLLC